MDGNGTLFGTLSGNTRCARDRLHQRPGQCPRRIDSSGDSIVAPARRELEWRRSGHGSAGQ
eukprot:1196341-Prorocentrum_minimum.AAC.3